MVLMLGDVDIGSHIHKKEISNERLDAVRSRLKKIEKNGLMCEMYQYEILYSEIISSEYLEIDLSFLQKSYDKKVGTYKKIVKKGNLFRPNKYTDSDIIVKIPAFAVYPYYGENKMSFEIECKMNLHDPQIKLYFGPKIPKIIESNLIKSFEFGGFPYEEIIGKRIIEKTKDSPGRFGYAFWDYKKEIPSDIVNRYLWLVKRVSEFNGIIPNNVKDAAEKAKVHFDKDLYIVKEIKPAQWEEPKKLTREISYDPLLLGIRNDKAYLIRHFNTTSLEDFVKDNYVKNKGN